MTRLSRRDFSRFLALSALAAPFLRTLRSSAAGTDFPKRLLIMSTPKGTEIDEFFPRVRHEPGEPVLELSGMTSGGRLRVRGSLCLRRGEVLGVAGLVGSGRTELLRYGPLELDRLKHKARIDGKTLDLTPKEFHLLQHFLLHPEEVVRRTELLEKVWDMHFDPESNVVDVHVGNLRRKLRQAVGRELIETVRGVGFRLQTPDRAEA